MKLSRPVPSPVSGKNILCLAIDRLNADFLGAFGNAWIETTSFDALAAESVVFDSFFATSLDLDALYRTFWRGENPARLDANADDFDETRSSPPSLFRSLKEKGYRTFVVSDVESVALHPAIDGDFCDDRFFLDSPAPELPAEKLEETRFFRNFEELARFLAKLDDDAKTAGGKGAAPWFVWAHFSGWNDVWDFPLEFRAKFREDEDDPEAYSATLPPFWPRESAQNLKKSVPSRLENGDGAADSDSVPDFAASDALDDEDADVEFEDGEVALQFAALEAARLSELDAPERRQSVVEAYSGGISAFDETLDGFVRLLKETGILDKTLFLTLGTRGFPTGFPGALGIDPTPDSPTAQVFAPDVDASDLSRAVRAPFYSEEIQLPLVIRLPNGVGATVRLPALCEPRDVFETLRRWPDFSDELATPEFWTFDSVEISPFSGYWSAENDAFDVGGESSASETETTVDFDATSRDVPGQNLLRLLADEDGSVRDRILTVARDAASPERALVVDDRILKSTPRPKTDAELFDETNFAAVSVPVATRRELFVRPDDRYCVNDVANRCVELVEKLASALENPNDARRP